MIVTLDELKSQLNQTLDVDDTLITSKILAAQQHIERLLGFGIEATYGGSGQSPIPDDLKEAVMQLAAWWYEQRETALVGVSSQSVPFGVTEIVQEYRSFTYV
jgi:Phage gp6-like head-tail connector protein